MRGIRSTLSSLNGLALFEASARHLSFAACNAFIRDVLKLRFLPEIRPTTRIQRTGSL